MLWEADARDLKKVSKQSITMSLFYLMFSGTGPYAELSQPLDSLKVEEGSFTHSEVIVMGEDGTCMSGC